MITEVRKLSRRRIQGYGELVFDHWAFGLGEGFVVHIGFVYGRHTKIQELVNRGTE
jgi:hypothetical protein